MLILGLLGAVLLYAGWNLWGTFLPGGGAPSTGASAVGGGGMDVSRFDKIEFPNWADWVAGSGSAGRDPFNLGASPVVNAPPPPPPPQEFVAPPPQAPREPPPPPIPFTYAGMGRAGGSGVPASAILMGEDGKPYASAAGDTLLGRYRIREVTPEFVVIEDLQLERSERLAANFEN